MLTFEDARTIALRHIGPGCGLVVERIIERPYGWYFVAQSKEYLQIRDVRKALVASSGFLVERESGRIVSFGSAYPPEKWLADYERGFKYEAYDLTILSITDMETTLELSGKLRLTYVEAELEHGTVWRIPKHFTNKQLKERLSKLPATFFGQNFWPVTDVFARIDAAGCCVDRLSEHQRE